MERTFESEFAVHIPTEEKRTILLSSACLSLNHIGFTHGKRKTL